MANLKTRKRTSAVLRIFNSCTQTRNIVVQNSDSQIAYTHSRYLLNRAYICARIGCRRTLIHRPLAKCTATRSTIGFRAPSKWSDADSICSARESQTSWRETMCNVQQEPQIGRTEV